MPPPKLSISRLFLPLTLLHPLILLSNQPLSLTSLLLSHPLLHGLSFSILMVMDNLLCSLMLIHPDFIISLPSSLLIPSIFVEPSLSEHLSLRVVCEDVALSGLLLLFGYSLTLPAFGFKLGFFTLKGGADFVIDLLVLGMVLCLFVLLELVHLVDIIHGAVTLTLFLICTVFELISLLGLDHLEFVLLLHLTHEQVAFLLVEHLMTHPLLLMDQLLFQSGSFLLHLSFFSPSLLLHCHSLVGLSLF